MTAPRIVLTNPERAPIAEVTGDPVDPDAYLPSAAVVAYLRRTADELEATAAPGEYVMLELRMGRWTPTRGTRTLP